MITNTRINVYILSKSAFSLEISLSLALLLLLELFSVDQLTGHWYPLINNNIKCILPLNLLWHCLIIRVVPSFLFFFFRSMIELFLEIVAWGGKEFHIQNKKVP